MPYLYYIKRPGDAAYYLGRDSDDDAAPYSPTAGEKLLLDYPQIANAPDGTLVVTVELADNLGDEDTPAVWVNQVQRGKTQVVSEINVDHGCAS